MVAMVTVVMVMPSLTVAVTATMTATAMVSSYRGLVIQRPTPQPRRRQQRIVR